MKVEHLRINGMHNPLGFALQPLRCAWRVTDTAAQTATGTVIEVAADAAFTHILYTKTGAGFNAAGTLLDLPLTPRTRYFWRVRVAADNGETAQSSGADWFETGKLDEPWAGQWIRPAKEDAFHPVFAKTFAAGGGIQQARLYISGVGLYEAELNGQKVGDEVLTPYYSDYRTECQYQTFDVTAQLQAQNTLRVRLGNGWYKGRFGLNTSKENFGNAFHMIAELRIQYADGRQQVIPSDTTWTYTRGETTLSDIYDGETIDRTQPAGEAKAAQPGGIEGALVERYSLPVREMETLPVQQVLCTPAGETVLDFGQNFAGYVVFGSKGLPKGAHITLDFAEILQHGNFYNANYRSAKSQFNYVADGREELVCPRFTFFGFRYVRVTGWPGKVNASDFVGKVLYSAMETTGHIETGHPGVNRLFLNALWGQKSNFIDFPTDCPQRDERLGWCGDAQVFAGTASYNMDTAAFYSKFLHDLRVEQQKLDGIMPGVIPVFDPKGAVYSAVWGDVATILPTVLYRHSGDDAALARHYPIMKDWVDRIDRDDAARGRRYLYDFGYQLGDWLALDGRTEQSTRGGTDESFIASCYYADSVRMVAEAAHALGYAADEEHYRALHQSIRAAVLQEYYTASGRLCIDTQTGYIVALATGLYLDKQRIVDGLRERLYKDCFRLKGGFVGAPIMCRVMAENGMEEEAYYFLLQRDYPGWLHCVELGATTIWERWNSVLDNGLLSGVDMNSLNHYSFGAVVEFLYRDAAGLRPLAPGFAKAHIAPLPDARLGWLKAHYDCPYGRYRSEWRIEEDGMFTLTVEVPFGCRAVVALPYHPEQACPEVGAGVHTFRYRPTRELRVKYSPCIPFKEMVDDEKVMAALTAVAPGLVRHLNDREEEYLCETVETLRTLPPYMGYTEQLLSEIKAALAQCY